MAEDDMISRALAAASKARAEGFEATADALTQIVLDIIDERKTALIAVSKLADCRSEADTTSWSRVNSAVSQLAH